VLLLAAADDADFQARIGAADSRSTAVLKQGRLGNAEAARSREDLSSSERVTRNFVFPRIVNKKRPSESMAHRGGRSC
jgi:hypothetical protein